MSYTYWLHEKIQKDLNEGFTWYEERRTGLGYEFLQAIENTISEIIAHPEVYGSKGNPDFREALIKRFPYVIVYRIYKRKKEIFISAVHHTKRFPRKKYRRP